MSDKRLIEKKFETPRFQEEFLKGLDNLGFALEVCAEDSKDPDEFADCLWKSPDYREARGFLCGLVKGATSEVDFMWDECNKFVDYPLTKTVFGEFFGFSSAYSFELLKEDINPALESGKALNRELLWEEYADEVVEWAVPRR
ncbi:hypothetical protein DRO97_04195 [Archaeoglobales archaeon]|nr:MAG: hypothetical protein DRO97_04195 [Archaeoglobales archaeon]